MTKRYVLIIAIVSVLGMSYFEVMQGGHNVDIRLIAMRQPEMQALFASSLDHTSQSKLKNAVLDYSDNYDNEAFNEIVNKYPANDSYVMFIMNEKKSIDDARQRLVTPKEQKPAVKRRSAQQQRGRKVAQPRQQRAQRFGKRIQPKVENFEAEEVMVPVGLTSSQKHWIDEFIKKEKESGRAVREALLREFPVAHGMQRKGQGEAVKNLVSQYFDSAW